MMLSVQNNIRQPQAQGSNPSGYGRELFKIEKGELFLQKSESTATNQTSQSIESREVLRQDGDGDPGLPCSTQIENNFRALTINSGRFIVSAVDEDMLLALAHQKYKAGSYAQALEHSNAVYDKNPQRTDNLLLLGAIYYQLHDFDMCIAKNEEAIRIDPQFAECFGNMANAWKEKGNIDLAIQLYLIAIELRPNFCDAWSNLASAYMRKGRLSEAAECCRQALHLNPRLVDAHSNLGNLLKAQGLTQHAYLCYMEALRIQPTFAIAWSNLAGLFMEAGDYTKALAYYKEAIKLKPNFADAHLNQGNVLKAMGRPQEAILCYKRAIQIRPDYAIAYGNLASVYYEQGELESAIMHYRQAIMLDTAFLEAYNNLGNALKDAGRVEEAIACYQSCLTLQANHPQALTNLGNIYMEWNMINVAANFYKATLAVTTGLSAPYSNLAIIYKQQGHYAEAIACYNEVLRIDPTAADGLVNRGNTLKEIGRVSEAIQDYIRAVTIRPTMAEAHANLASAYKDSGHVEAAMKSYKQALTLRPDFPEATCNLLHTLQCVCNWEDRDSKFMEVDGIIRRQIKLSVLPSVQPFHAIAYPIDPMLALEISRKYAEHCTLIASRFGLPPFNHPPPIPVKSEGGSGRLRVGYVSSDFGNHPLSHLMGSVFGMHNREYVEVFCYALSQNDGSEWRQRIQAEAEHFIDVSSFSSDVIARMISEDNIQVLVNLNGYTKGARNEIFAMQPAPIQVSYMGFPGTTGADYIHYLVTDEFVSPMRFAHIYSEKLVHMPHCYFVNDYKQKNRDVLDPNCQHKRTDYGLPEGKFLFGCFNQLYKMDPEIFTTWCNILKRVPHSALWLLRFPAAGESNVRAFAAAQGVRPEQIIFTDVAAKSEHIRRSALADLFLDTPLCNAHTTGTDILWAGLPMITLPLEKMATRVAGSLCHATGFGEEMVVGSMQEYEDKAVSLALSPLRLQTLRAKLKAARLTCPLFDTARWVRNLDRAYYKMWNLYCAGQHPQPFKVTENDTEFPCDH
ncbi:probable UDP-N-acetylglucosamine--peptide N-acetylglucosaminyltransferase SEC isoform X1 [Cryptomeria japonica]|uniref:probable UDP-N-acetylglucosamine--peptide N-acetylglucosaminyltransferase SEC isoform X1 n=1 Tax=Cryptomeria japonica TaxID=3369 RepID=UPI0025AD7997|nr:probable UDP-N-acetylglucosamine--peptide N-acetylglucosaminyltransferase SEC isoform X1 [Cryptomeria japonica]